MIVKIAAALLPVALAWGALGWYAWRLETRRGNRLGAVEDLQRGVPLSETPYIQRLMAWEPE
jgi:hypothetical protein